MKVENYIKVDGKYIPQEELPKETLQKIQTDFVARLAKGFGYEPVPEEEKEKAVV